MKSCIGCTTLLFLLPLLVSAQESPARGEWEIMPGLAFVKLFPGAQLDIPGYGDYGDRVYAGTELNFSVRAFNSAIPNIALTFGGGVTWFYYPHELSVVVATPTAAGIGSAQWRQDFTVFPLSVGAQFVYPAAAKEKLMFYAGGEGTVNFIDGRIMPGQQTKIGYTVLAGFAVKIVEFGFRYSAFSDMKNLGAHIGVRFNPFML